MKKFLAMFVALMLVLGMSSVALAEIEFEATTAGFGFNIEKEYVSDENFIPGETLKFTVEADIDNLDDPVITVGSATTNSYTITQTDIDDGANKKSLDIPVYFPSYDTAGVYKYTIKEVNGSTPGVTYDAYETTGKYIGVTVVVGFNQEEKSCKLTMNTI